MLPFKTLIIFREDRSAAIYLQIAQSLINHIQQGTIKPGVFLPGSRVMATLLGVHRNTVMAAYDELASQNWITTIPRKGVRVALEIPVIKPKGFSHQPIQAPSNAEAKFKFGEIGPGQQKSFPPVNKKTIIINDGFPDLDLVPLETILREYRKLSNSPRLKSLMSLKDLGGTPKLKEALCNFLNNSRGLNISEENLVVTRGAQMAIYIAASLIIKPGDKILISDPNYTFANLVFEKLGAKLTPVKTDENGILVDELERKVKKGDIKLIYLIPHHHHPTTVTLSPERRLKLLEIINEHTIPVIEDDYDYDFHYENNPVLPLASAAHNGNIIYIGSLTKLLAPSFRIGYMIAPANFVSQAMRVRSLMDLRGDTIMEEAIATMIQNGGLTRHIKKALKVYKNRCDLMSDLLTGQLKGAVTFTKPQGGLALWLKFAKEFPLSNVMPEAAAANLFLNGSSYYLGPYQDLNALRMGFASLNEPDMHNAVDILSKVLFK